MDIPLYSVALKTIPAHYVISVRGIIETPDKEAELWERLAQERKDKKFNLRIRRGILQFSMMRISGERFR